MKHVIRIRFDQKLKHFFANDLVRFAMLGLSCIMVAAALVYFVEREAKDRLNDARLCALLRADAGMLPQLLPFSLPDYVKD